MQDFADIDLGLATTRRGAAGWLWVFPSIAASIGFGVDGDGGLGAQRNILGALSKRGDCHFSRRNSFRQKVGF